MDPEIGNIFAAILVIATRIIIIALVVWIIVKFVKFTKMIILNLMGDFHTMAEARKIEAEAKLRMAEKEKEEK